MSHPTGSALSRGPGNKATLLDRLMPAADHRESHSIRVAAPPDRVWDALHRVTFRDVPLARVLMGLRDLPARLRGRGGGLLPLDEPLLDVFREMGFITVAEEPGQALAMGAAARFWRASPARPPRFQRGADLLSFDEPGYAKAVMSFEVAPAAGGSVLMTETRVQSTDAASRRRFRRYWLLIRPGSGLIRRVLLRAIRRRAQH